MDYLVQIDFLSNCSRNSRVESSLIHAAPLSVLDEKLDKALHIHLIGDVIVLVRVERS